MQPGTAYGLAGERLTEARRVGLTEGLAQVRQERGIANGNRPRSQLSGMASVVINAGLEW
jgi:hypothetical protein